MEKKIMSQFQMTHVALVGARMDAFRAYGYRQRSEMAMRRIVPDAVRDALEEPAQLSLLDALAKTLPFWVHNAITDHGIPERKQLLMSLRRFEGELLDNRNNEVVAAVLSAGFRNRPLDPLHLPDSMPLRQRCALLLHIDPWKDAYRRLEREFSETLWENEEALENWVATARAEPELSPSDAA
jgi:hypothetical protein